MKVLVLTRYGRLGSSSRYRFYQYLPHLERQGMEFDIAPLLGDDYIPQIYSGHRVAVTDLLPRFWQRLSKLSQCRCYDLIWVEKEIFPYLPYWIERLWADSRVPYIVDYDDAAYHTYDLHSSWLVRLFLGKKIDGVMREAKVVVAGNSYIAERAAAAGAKRVEILPTVIDLDRYAPSLQVHNSLFTIGWIGAPVTTGYLRHVHGPLKEVCSEGDTAVIAVGASKISLEGVPLKIVEWSEESEVAEMQKFDVGIMPLPNSPWEVGKCGLKLIQYMGVALPVVASPIGVNSRIVEHGENGFLAETADEWIRAFHVLKANKALRRRMGAIGRAKVEKEYCLQVTVPAMSRLLREAASS